MLFLSEELEQESFHMKGIFHQALSQALPSMKCMDSERTQLL